MSGIRIRRKTRTVLEVAVMDAVREERGGQSERGRGRGGREGMRERGKRERGDGV